MSVVKTEQDPISEYESLLINELKSLFYQHGMGAIINDNILIRYARSFPESDPQGREKAYNACSKMLQWRLTNQSRISKSRNGSVGQPAKHDVFLQYWNISVRGQDVDGHLIWYHEFGKNDFNELASVFTPEEIYWHVFWELEQVDILRDKTVVNARSNKRIYKNIVVLDVKSLKSKNILKQRDLLIKIVNDAQVYYAETLYQMQIKNVSVLFKCIWSLLTPFIDKSTLQKIKIS